MNLATALLILQVVGGVIDVAKGIHMIQGWIARGKDTDPLEGGHLETLRAVDPAAHRVLTANLNAFQAGNDEQVRLTLGA